MLAKSCPPCNNIPSLPFSYILLLMILLFWIAYVTPSDVREVKYNPSRKLYLTVLFVKFEKYNPYDKNPCFVYSIVLLMKLQLVAFFISIPLMKPLITQFFIVILFLLSILIPLLE